MMRTLAILLCVPLASAFTTAPTSAFYGTRPAVAATSSPFRSTPAYNRRAATSISGLNMKIPKIIQGGMGVQVFSPDPPCLPASKHQGALFLAHFPAPPPNADETTQNWFVRRNCTASGLPQDHPYFCLQSARKPGILAQHAQC